MVDEERDGWAAPVVDAEFTQPALGCASAVMERCDMA